VNMPRASYTDIVAMLRQQILSGQVPPGGQVPSEPTLTRQFGVTRTTVRDAYVRLIQEGLVIRRPGRGHFVRPRQPLSWHMTRRDRIAHADDPRPLGEQPAVDPWLAVVTAAGYTGRQDIQVRVVGPDEPLAGRSLGEVMRDSGGDPATRAVVRDRIRYVDGNPQELARSYFPYVLAEEISPLLDAEDIQPSIFHLMADRGYRQTTGEDHAYARMPTQDEHERLKILGVLPVMETVRVLRFTPDDQVLLVRHTVAVGGSDKEWVWEV
jgi:GntR family transcriptional regulator